VHIAPVEIVAPILVAVIYILANSALQEPQRRHFNAIMIAGAGAAYLNGGLGIWEFAFTPVVTYCAYRGLTSYGFIGVGCYTRAGMSYTTCMELLSCRLWPHPP